MPPTPSTTSINPFFAARRSRLHTPITDQVHTWAKLPKAPVTTSPVPHLTGLYHHDDAGPYRDRRYPGNCGGNLIKDLLRFFRPARVLDPGGRLAILIGDYTDRHEGLVPQVYHTKRLASEAGLWQCCTDIIRLSHGAGSGRKVYRSSFIPGLHDVCMIFKR
jgi:hypothetical protein